MNQSFKAGHLKKNTANETDDSLWHKSKKQKNYERRLF